MPKAAKQWIYGLLYPAFLGTVIVNLFRPGSLQGDPAIAWGIVLAIYFATQHGEGITDEAPYTRWRFLQSTVELLSLIGTFYWLGILTAGDWSMPVLANIAAIVAFLTPPVGRWFRERSFNFSSALSVLAAYVTLGIFSYTVGAVVVLALVIIYVWKVLWSRVATA